MPKAFSYIRFSSGAQASGSSLERQQEMLAAWLVANPSYTISDIRYADLGLSGYKGDHLEHGLGQLLAAIDTGTIKHGDAILVESMSRLGRLAELDMLDIVKRIVQAGVSLITLEDNTTYTADMQTQIWQLLGKIQQAHNYSKQLSGYITASYKGRRAKAKAGETIKRRTPVWLTSDGKIKADIQPFIIQAFEDYAAGLGERRILDRIRGKHTAFEKLNPSTIKRWFVNKTAIGYWGDIPDVYPEVVTKELFYRVQQRLEEVYRPATASRTYLLSGLVKCKECGTNMTIKVHKHSAATLSCGRRARLGTSACTNNRTMPKQVLEDCRAQTTLEAIQQAFKSQQLSESGKRLIEIEGDVNSISRQISRLAETIKTVGLIPEIQEQLEELTERRKTLEAEKILIDRTDSSLDLEGIVNIEKDLLNTDAQKLNSLLQSVGYALQCDAQGKVFYQNELVCEYKGYDRKTNSYIYIMDGDEYKKPDHFRYKQAIQRLSEIHDAAPEPNYESDAQNLLLKLRARNSAIPKD